MKKTENKNKVERRYEKTARVPVAKAVKLKPGGARSLFLLGADEVGRGPLAGPVTVCVAALRKDCEVQVQKELKRLSGRAYPLGKDSKKMTESEREFWFEYLRVLEKLGDISFFVGSESARNIDKKGIAVCIRNILERLVKKAGTKVAGTSGGVGVCELRADAGLRVELPVFSQKAIVKGDEKEFVISIASVYAKVTRDAHMKRLSKKSEFAVYGFADHKGYGTLKHRKAIQKHGLSREHRKGFCSRIIDSV